MGLVLSRGVDESYFLFANGKIDQGGYIKIKKIDIYKGSNSSELSVKDLIDAPDGVTILREELVDEIGGLEEVIKQMKEGNFNFRNKKNG